MIARTAGPCVGDCGGRIHPGDENESGPGEGWRHVECGHVDRGQETIEQLAGMGRCPTCGWHPPTQNHDPRCPEHQPTETKEANRIG